MSRVLRLVLYAQLPELFFEEDVGGYVPHAGSIYDKLPVIMQMLRAALATPAAAPSTPCIPMRCWSGSRQWRCRTVRYTT